MNQNSGVNWRVVAILLMIGIVHLLFAIVLSIILRVAYVRTIPFEFMFDVLPALWVLAQAVGYAIAIFVGLYLGRSVGLGAPLLESWMNGEEIRDRAVSALKISFVLGSCVAVVKFILDRFLFSQFVPSLLMQWKQIPFGLVWIIPFEQGIGDEIFHRLFWMTILVWIIYKIQKPENNQPTPIGVWTAILIATIFSIPGTVFWFSGPIIGLQLTILTAVGGIVFGWLYWKKGIESAILAHFISSVVLVVLSLY
jgi:hypothetical protein